MILVTKKKFAEMCGMQTKNLSVYIIRSQVVANAEGMIDIEFELNKYFYEKQIRKNGGKPFISNDLPIDVAASTEKKVPDSKKEVQSVFDFPSAETSSPSRNSQLDEKIKQTSLEKERLNSELLKSKLEKIRGESIPTSLVKNLFLHHCKSITVSFKNGADALITQIAKMKGLDKAELAELRVQLIDIINKSVNDSIDESKRSVQNIVAEHSQKREVGERE